MKVKAQEITGTTVVGNIANLETLIKCGRLALEDCDWWEARKCFEQALEIDRGYASVYVGRLCSDISIHTDKWVKNDMFTYVIRKEEDLAHYYKQIDEMDDYKRALRVADETYRAQLEGYNSAIKRRNVELRNEFMLCMIVSTAYQESYYNMGSSGKFIRNSSYHPSKTLIRQECTFVGSLSDGLHVKILRTGNEYEIKQNGGSYLVFDTNENSIKDGDVIVITHEMHRKLLREEEERHKEEKERIEQRAIAMARERQEEYDNVVEAIKTVFDDCAYRTLGNRLEALGDYKNSSELATRCFHQANIIEERRKAKEKRNRLLKRLFGMISSIVLSGIIGGLVFVLIYSIFKSISKAYDAGAVLAGFFSAILVGIVSFFVSWYKNGWRKHYDEMLSGCLWGCGGLIGGYLIGVILGALSTELPTVKFVSIGVIIGVLIGGWIGYKKYR
jgi:tetratricopeptide (TPR) repeat protein